MAAALRAGDVVSEVQIDAVVDDAVATWRAANRGRELPAPIGGKPPREWEAILDLMYHSTADYSQREALAIALMETLGYTPLRMTVGSDGRLAVYAAPKETERDDRFEPFVWVHRITLDFRDGKAQERSRKWTALQEADASEKVLREWPEACVWFTLRKTTYSNLHAKREALSAFGPVEERVAPLMGTLTGEAFEALFSEWDAVRRAVNAKERYVTNLSLCLPMGLVEDGYGEKYMVSLLAEDAHAVLHDIAPDDGARTRVHAAFMALYGNQERGEHRFQETLGRRGNRWSLVSMAFDPTPKPRIFITASQHYGDIRRERVDPTIDAYFPEWVPSKGKKASYFADGVRREDGSFRFDEILGLKFPDGYGPYNIVHAAAKPAGKGGKLSYPVMIDASKKPLDHKRAMEWEGTQVSWTSGTNTVATLDDVSAYVRERAGQSGMRAVHHGKLRDAPVPPEGVERWYLLPKEREGEE